MSGDQDEPPRIEIDLVDQPPDQLEAALLAEIHVDEGHVRLQLRRTTDRLGARGGDSDDAEPFPLEERAQAAWPPFSRLAALRDSARTGEAALTFLTQARGLARQLPSGVRLLGPVPAAMHKRAGRYHAQLLLESRERRPLHAFLDEWLPAVEQLKSARAVRWSLDVDPIELF